MRRSESVTGFMRQPLNDVASKTSSIETVVTVEICSEKAMHIQTLRL